MQFSFKSLCALTLVTPLLFSQTVSAQQENQRGPDRMFSRFDTNNDGFIDQAEVDVMITNVMKRVDADSDGSVSEQEAQNAHKKMRKHHAKKHGKHRDAKRRGKNRGNGWMKRADTDGDGVITRLEFDIAGVKQRARMFAELDRNGDGVLTKADRDGDGRAGKRGKHAKNKDRGDRHGKMHGAARDGDHKQRKGGRMAILFEQFDTNKDGTLSRTEVEAEIDGVRMPKERRLQIFDRVDADKDGNVTKEELTTASEKAKAMRQDNKGKRQSFLIKRFGEFDADGDKTLSADEISQAKIVLFEQADSDKDGKLSSVEIRDYMKKQRSAN
ncbi:MAG: EF-hand domain-containing protein [Stappiaceae bacterium]